VAPGVNPDLVDLLYDPQTSGGLLAAVPDAHAARVVAALGAASVSAAIVGRAGPPAGVPISIR
jgi:selenide,water dikinase